MKGAASPDNHALLIQQIKEHGGKSYDLRDHEQILAAYNHFLDQFGFRKAFPTAGDLFKSVSRRAYQSWGQFMENIRICDVNDYSAISGWESTAIEDHSGLVDNMRDFKTNPEWIAKSMLPVRPVAKQRHLVLNTGERGSFDLYLLNDTGKPITGKLRFTLTSPDGKVSRLGTFAVPQYRKDHLSYLVQTQVATPPLDRPGIWRTNLQLNAAHSSMHTCDLWVIDSLPHRFNGLHIGISGGRTLAEKLKQIPGLQVEPFSAGQHYDVIVAAAELTPEQQRVSAEGGKAWKAMKPEAEAPVHFSPAILSALQSGTPLFAFAETDGGAEGFARQMAQAGAFTYDGLVGPQRASWMGSWYFVREHPLYSGMPVDQGMSIHYQVKGSSSNGWRVSGNNVEVVVGYSRDHDRHIGAGTLTGTLGKGRYVMHRIIGMHPVLEQRFLANCLAYLIRQT